MKLASLCQKDSVNYNEIENENEKISSLLLASPPILVFPNYFSKKSVPPTQFFENFIFRPFENLISQRVGCWGVNYAWYNLDQAETK